MTIRIKNETNPKREPELSLYLERTPEGIILKGEDEDGKKWHIARIDSDGMYLYSDVQSDAIALNSLGCIVVRPR